MFFFLASICSHALASTLLLWVPDDRSVGCSAAGSTAELREAAAEQVCSVAKAHPSQLPALLRRVCSLLASQAHGTVPLLATLCASQAHCVRQYSLDAITVIVIHC